MSWKSLGALKGWILISAVLLWNLSLLYPVIHSGNEIFVLKIDSSLPFGAVCLVFSFMAIGVAFSKSFRKICLADSRAANFSRQEFILVAMLLFPLGSVQLGAWLGGA